MKLNQIEHDFLEIQSAYDEHNISREEYLNLLQGLDVEKSITEDAEELARKEYLKSLITAAITVVSVVS